MDGIGVANGCLEPGLSVESDALLLPIDVSVDDVGLFCPPLVSEIFSDGFESGDTTAWD